MRWVVGLAVIVTACGRIDFDPLGGGDGGPGSGDGGVANTCPWTNVTPLVSLDSVDNDWEPTISPDGLTIVFTRTLADFSSSHLYTSHRASLAASFPAPAVLSILEGGNSEAGAVWSSDGTYLYFISDRVTAGTPELYVTMFDGTSFHAPSAVVEFAGMGVVGPGLSDDGLEMFYCNAGMLSEFLHATRTSLTTAWQLDGPVAELDGSTSNCWASLSPDGLTIFFESDRDDIDGLIYRATRPAIGSAFTGITKVVELDTGVADGDPDLTPDGLTMYFAGQPSTNPQDLFVATRACL